MPGIERNCLHMVKAIHDNPTANIILIEERLKAFPLRSQTRLEYLLLRLSFKIALEVLARAVR